MKRNVIATLLAALLVIGFLGLAAAQGATIEHLVSVSAPNNSLLQ